MPNSIDIVVLADVKTQLNIVNDTTFDNELSNYITAASQMWVDRVGPVQIQGTAYDEWYDGGGDRIALLHSPVASILQVQEVVSATAIYTLNNQTLQSGGDNSPWGYSADLNAGIIFRRVAGIGTRFTPGNRNIHVTYTAGYSTVPEDIKLAVRLLIKHMWEMRRGGGKRPNMGGDGDMQPFTEFLWPRRAEEIAQSYLIPGIA